MPKLSRMSPSEIILLVCRANSNYCEYPPQVVGFVVTGAVSQLGQSLITRLSQDERASPKGANGNGFNLTCQPLCQERCEWNRKTLRLSMSRWCPVSCALQHGCWRMGQDVGFFKRKRGWRLKCVCGGVCDGGGCQQVCVNTPRRHEPMLSFSLPDLFEVQRTICCRTC